MENTEPSKISELYAAIGTSPTGDEGIGSIVNPVTRIMEPLVGGEKRLGTILTLAKAGIKAAREQGVEMSFEIVKFTIRESIVTINSDTIDNEFKG